MKNFFQELVEKIRKIPSVSKKEAEKIAYFFALNKNNEASEIIDSIKKINSRLSKCPKCNFIFSEDQCPICFDKFREKVLVVVETFIDVLKFEETLDFKPHYFILENLLNPNRTKQVILPNFEKLIKMSKNFKEIILALSSNLKGIVTMKFLKKNIKHSKVTKLAQGIPIGAEIEYVDELTLKSAFKNREGI